MSAGKWKDEPLKAGWLPNELVAKKWAQYTKDTVVSDDTPPPAPTRVTLKGAVLTWQCEADLESGLASFIIERDGKEIASVPEKGKTRSAGRCSRTCSTATRRRTRWWR